MDRVPVCWQGAAAGELTVEREALYTCLSVSCRVPGEGLWCAWAVGEQGELRLGVLEPQGGQSVIRRRVPNRQTAPLGRLLRGEVRPAGEREANWTPEEAVDRLFQTPWLRQQLHGISGARQRMEGDCRCLALPYDPGKPFPLTALFCFASLRHIAGQAYVVYGFNKEEWPVFLEKL